MDEPWRRGRGLVEEGFDSASRWSSLPTSARALYSSTFTERLFEKSLHSPKWGCGAARKATFSCFGGVQARIDVHEPRLGYFQTVSVVSFEMYG